MSNYSFNLDRAAFFSVVRRENFNGRLKQTQVDGLNAILDYAQKRFPKMIDSELAYVLATAQWESAHSMQPIEEGFPLKGDALRRFQRKLRYFPWFGRGHVQLTWENNYRRFGLLPPETALDMDNSLRVLFEGMIFGIFRKGHRLADYFSPTHSDPVGARLIVNGVPRGGNKPDRADEIAALWKGYVAALTAGRQSRNATAPAPIADVRAAQQRLADLGYALGPIDGIIGEATTGAIAMFQYTNNLEITGRLDAVTLDHLMTSSAEPSEISASRQAAEPEDIEGSRTIAAANKVETGGWSLLAALLAFLFAPDLTGASALAQKGLRLLFAAIAVWIVWRVVTGARDVKTARLDDYRSGANLGR